jgi:hypothetical protein
VQGTVVTSGRTLAPTGTVGDSLPGGDELVFDLDGLDQGTPSAGLPSGRGAMHQ